MSTNAPRPQNEGINVRCLDGMNNVRAGLNGGSTPMNALPTTSPSPAPPPKK